jgi:anti-anti-sigma regulatory factor
MTELSSQKAVLALHNRFQWGGTSELDRASQELIHGGYRTIILDLSSLDTINTLTISWILDFWERLWARGKELQVKGCNTDIRSTFRSLRADRYIRFVE